MSGHELPSASHRELLTQALIKLNAAQAKLDAWQRRAHEGVAIVGVGCRFPGAVEDVEGYWRLLAEGVDAVEEIPAERWPLAAFYDPDPDRPGTTYCRMGSFLRDVDRFEPRAFGITPREAARMDPQHRLLLEVAWEAIERSGRSPAAMLDTRTGVFIGLMGQDYTQLATASPERIDAHTGAGNSPSVAAGRLAHVFGLRGPCLTIDTACSSSLVALHLAIRALREGQADYALAGGVNLALSPIATLIESRSRMLAASGRCRSFADDADGIVRGEGCALLVLRRLSDAIVEGDPILAVIRGSAINHDGRTSSLTVPSGPAQERVIRDALADAELEPAAIGYVEAHGTGTPLGDPIELEALGAVYGRAAGRRAPLRVGSVKTNLGHLEGAAGIAGLLKAALCVAQASVPPHLHLRAPNRHVDLDRLGIEIPTRATTWAEGQPRVAAVSSFGFSGTNAHVIVEAPPPASERGPTSCRAIQVLPLSARSPGALAQLALATADRIEALGEPSFVDACHTARIARSGASERLVVLTSDPRSAGEALRRAAAGEHDDHRIVGRSPTLAPTLAFAFTGQGSHHVGMARELFACEPVFRAELERCEAILSPCLPVRLTRALFEAEGDPLGSTALAQPALVALGWSLAKLLQSWGVRPDAVLGHSVGEFTAAMIAGVIEPEQALPLVATRGRLMQGLAEPGAMLTIDAGSARVGEWIAEHPRVAIAALNGPDHTVIAGDRAALDSIAARLRAAGIGCRSLPVSHGFHSPLMEPMLPAFADALAGIELRRPRLGFASTLEGALVDEAPTRPEYWLRHARESVRFADALAALAETGVELFVEIGAKPTLVHLARASSPSTTWLPTLHPRQGESAAMLRTLAELWARGVAVDWAGFDRDRGPRRRVLLPTQPFERQRCWLDVPAPWLATPGVARPTRLLGAAIESAALPIGVRVYSTSLGSELGFVADHRVHATAVVPAAAFVSLALAAGRERLAGTSAITLTDAVIQQPLFAAPEAPREVQTIVEPGVHSQLRCRILSRARSLPSDSSSEAPWSTHFECTLSADAGEREPSERPELGPGEPVEPDALHAEFARRGVEYGPSMRRLIALRRGQGWARGWIDVDADEPMHPAILDACLQTAAAIVEPETLDATHLPVGFDELRVFAGMPAPMPARVEVLARRRPGVAAGPSSLAPTDLWLLDETGRTVATILGVAVRRAEREQLLRAVHGHADDELRDAIFRPSWQPASELGERSLARRWLIFADAAGLGERLADGLRARGCTCVLVRRDAITDPREPDREPEPEFGGFDTIVRASECDAIAYLWGLDGEAGELARALELGSVGALHLVQALDAHARAPRLVLFTRTGRDPAQAPLGGLGQVIVNERPTLRCLRVDVGDDPDEARLLAALSLDEREGQVAITAQGIMVARLERSRLAATEPAASLRADACYLIAGGLGELGLAVATWMVDQGARELILLARRAPTAEAAPRIEALRAAGITVHVELGDLGDRDRLAEIFAAQRRRPTALRGILHAAGELHDAALANQRRADFEQVARAKIHGAWHLHELSAGLELDFFVCFSSIAALIGTPGQANYAAANAFLAGLAEHRRARGLCATTIDWGSWAELGMAARMARASSGARSLGLRPISIAAGLRVLGRAIAGELPAHVAVMPVDWRALAEALPSFAEQRFAAARIGDALGASDPSRGLAPRTGAPALLDRLNATPLRRRRATLLAWVRAEIGVVLGMSGPEAVGPRERLFDLGVDSLLAVEIRNRLILGSGCTRLRATAVFDFPSAEQLADHLGTLLEIPLEPDAEPASQAGTRDADELALTDQIRSLSELELTALIDDELDNLLR